MKTVKLEDLSYTTKFPWTGKTSKIQIMADSRPIRVFESMDAKSGKLHWSANRPDNHPVNEYFLAFETIADLKKQKAFEAAFQIAKRNVGGLVTLLQEDIEDYGRVVISSSPILDYVVEEMPFSSHSGSSETELKQIETSVCVDPLITEWSASYWTSARERISVWGALLRHLQNHPNSEQATLAKTVDLDARIAAQLLRDAEARQLIILTPHKRTKLVSLL